MTVLTDEFLQSIGIKGTSGAFDFTKEAIEQEGRDKILEDNTKFLPDEIRAKNRADVRKALSKPTPHVSQIGDTIWGNETPNKRGVYEVYEGHLPDGGVDINVGPGIKLDDPTNAGLFKDVGLDPNVLKLGRGKIEDPIVIEKLDQVYNKRVKRAEQDAIRYVGGSGSWKRLTDNEKSAFIEMAYNLGASKLNTFKRTRAYLDELIKFRKGKKGYSEKANEEIKAAIASEMMDSKWYTQVGTRSQEVINRFLGEDIGLVERFKKWMHS